MFKLKPWPIPALLIMTLIPFSLFLLVVPEAAGVFILGLNALDDLSSVA